MKNSVNNLVRDGHPPLCVSLPCPSLTECGPISTLSPFPWLLLHRGGWECSGVRRGNSYFALVVSFKFCYFCIPEFFFFLFVLLYYKCWKICCFLCFFLSEYHYQLSHCHYGHSFLVRFTSFSITVLGETKKRKKKCLSRAVFNVKFLFKFIFSCKEESLT